MEELDIFIRVNNLHFWLCREPYTSILWYIYILCIICLFIYKHKVLQLYIFDIPKIKLYAAHTCTCISMAQILIPMFQFLCVWKLLKQIVYCLWCCKLAWLKFEIEPLEFVHTCMYACTFIHLSVLFITTRFVLNIISINVRQIKNGIFFALK